MFSQKSEGVILRRVLTALILLLMGIVVLNCRRPVARQGWTKRWGPMVPHKTFPGDCGICHLPDRWDVLKADFTFDHLKETGFALEGAHANAACLRCHNDRGPAKVYFARGCGGCHADPHQAKLGMDCVRCHEPDLTTWRPQGTLADHARTRFPLFGAHVSVQCESCHERSQAGDYRGAPVLCELCHGRDLAKATNPDHQANGWIHDCQRCHTPSTWGRSNFNHAFFPLSGGHASVQCTGCHTSGTFAAISSDCFSCHQANFQAAPNHQSSGYSHDCRTCHTIRAWGSAVFDHSRFPLTEGHSKAKCTDCHLGGTLGRIPSDCWSCHQREYLRAPDHAISRFPHDCTQCHTKRNWSASTFTHASFPLTGGHKGVTCSGCHTGAALGKVQSDCWSCHGSTDFPRGPDHVAANFSHLCTDCHSSNAWKPAAFDHSFFPLTAGHGGLACARCHTSGTTAKLPTDCWSCHQKDFQGAPSHTSSGFSKDCTTCHSPNDWKPATFVHTATFPLAAGHSGLACAQCHTGAVLGKVASDCNSCHAAKFTAAASHAAAGFPKLCTQCHTTTHWTPSTFVHPGTFPLAAGHGGLACTKCHTGAALGKVASDCWSCHQADFSKGPNHVAQSYSHLCGTCHTTNGWVPAAFDHSKFPLTSGHSGLLCTQCHTAGTFGPIPADCASCHLAKYTAAASHAASGFSKTCTQCHTTVHWTPSTFVHPATFPLAAGHGGLACAKCHTAAVLGKVASDCNSCHAANYTAAASHAAAGFPKLCAQCHTTTHWTPATFVHPATFPLAAGHGGLACAKCHTAAVLGKVAPDCNSCHAANYTAAASHAAAGFPKLCAQCHTTTHWTPATFVHPATFPLAGGHGGQACTKCHTAAVLGKVASDCWSCHQADFQKGPNHVSQNYSHLCTTCHTTNAWLPATFDHSKFPLTSGHSGLLCTQCHTTGTLGPIPADCASCHLAKYTAAASHAAAGFSKTCTQCHTTVHWTPATFVHPGTFPLAAGHGGLACTKCHTAAVLGKVASDCNSCHAANYTAAASHAAAGFPKLCAQCHTTTHWTPSTFLHPGTFPLAGGHGGLACTKCHTAAVLGKVASDCWSCHQADFSKGPNHVSQNYSHVCTTCHTTNAWAPAAFDHSKFPLTSGHSGLLCTQCHTTGTFGPIPADCSSCHLAKYTAAASHAAAGFPKLCAQCHTTVHWTPSTFLHPGTFPLAAGHGGLACTKCHTGAVLGKVASDCNSCHAANYTAAASHAAAGFPKLCAQCHTTTRWAPATFVHPGTFPLAAGHGGLACTKCHTGAVLGKVASDCNSCHLANYTAAPSHAAAGFPKLCAQCHTTTRWTPSMFVHPATFPLAGGHGGQACTKCHTATVLGKVPSDCWSCHQADFQKGPNHVSQNYSHLCTTCHTTNAWLPATFDHSKFPLTSGHGGLLCTQCHTTGTLGPIPADCASCHLAKYTAAASHAAAGFSKTCTQCHTTVHWTPATFVHPATFPLAAGHGGLACTKCHTAAVLGKVASDCNSCHAANYTAAASHAAAGFSKTCTQCHTTVHWTPATFVHPATFPLAAGHGGLACTKCHTAAVLGKVASDCNSCHAANYTAAASHAAAGFSKLCAQCHTTTHWTPATFVHPATFPLAAGHGGLACTKCHTGAVLGKVASDCFSCHAANYTAAASHAAAGFPKLCAQCHTTTHWTPSTFVHPSTFPLAAGHGGLTCIKCHTGAVLGKVASDCNSCHAANYTAAASHAAAGFPKLCAQCHTTTHWTPSTFVHPATFPLTNSHGGLACTKCHTASVLGKVPVACYSCHSANFTAAASHAAAGFPHDCTPCHTTRAFVPSTFVHTATFALTGGHGGLQCTKCHTGAVLGKVPADCWSCHQADFQRGPNHVAGNFSHLCNQCHSLTAWIPATFTHPATFPLTLGHGGLACTQCHKTGTYTKLPTDCWSCHQPDYAKAVLHTQLNYDHACTRCHTMTNFTTPTFKHPFPLTGDHNVSCVTCHNASSATLFTCLTCHEHNQTSMDSQHKGRKGYSYTSTACYSCHPNGRS